MMQSPLSRYLPSSFRNWRAFPGHGSFGGDAVWTRPLSAPFTEFVLPVYNEERILEQSVNTLVGYLRATYPFPWRIVIADNASTDGTCALARRLSVREPQVSVLHLDRKGRGLALRTAWLASDADILVYMDIDLSTGLAAVLPLVAPLVTGHAQIAIGSRLSPQSHTTRQWKREFLSRGYNLLIRAAFRTRFRDAQCGFKAIRADAAHALLPLVEDTGWFFDTELLLLAERNGMRVVEVPVDWLEDLDTRVHIRSTVWRDLAGLWRMRRAFWRGEGQIAPTPLLEGVPTPMEARE
jgi:glycosyltransferase involved in cell wall biosynthesis